MNEAALWERLSQSRRAPLEPHWLGEVYSPSLSVDLRRALCEKLGMLADQGWPQIQSLIDQHGALPDLVMAAGLCHQTDARDWLLDQLTSSSQLDDINLCILQALSCWGADVPESVVKESLRHPGQQHRLAGLQLLGFRAHSLSDEELLTYCSELLNDFQRPCRYRSNPCSTATGWSQHQRKAGAALHRWIGWGRYSSVSSPRLHRHPQQPALFVGTQ